MKRLLALLLIFTATASFASSDPIADTRRILAGTVTTKKIQNEYLSGARDGTAAFKGALAAYKAVRAAEAPPAPPQPPKTCWDGSTIPATQSCPPPPPPVVAPVQDPAIPTTGLPSIASNFAVASHLYDVPLTNPIDNDVVGAFRFVCNAGQLLYDDPLVYPGQPGKSHLHQFFGNTAANANSTYATLRTSGDSTCMNILNRSAYWMPAMLNGRGQVVRPDYVTIYYKRFPKDSPYCTSMGKACVDLPRNLRYIFGYDMLTMSDPNPGAAYFTCDGANRSEDLIEIAKFCPNGKHVGAALSAPECWDGKNLDSANHQNHMATPSYGSWGYLKCPDTHPYIVPHFSMVAWFTVDDTLDKSGAWQAGVTKTWSLSSDDHNGDGIPDHKPGSTLHADWWGAWDDPTMKLWTDNCINRKLSCNSGDLGNGKAMTMYPGFSWTANPRLVATPARP